MTHGFQPFNPRNELRKTRRRLPHWQQPGATYFVTFRLADALPRKALVRLDELRRFNDDNQAFTWMDKYLDAGSGACPLADRANALMVASALRHFDGSRYALGAFVIMPNHVHALVQPSGSTELSAVIRGWKSFTAHELQRHAGLKGTVWQTESFDRIVRDETELRRFDDYIVGNPAAAKLRHGLFLTGRGTAQWID